MNGQRVFLSYSGKESDAKLVDALIDLLKDNRQHIEFAVEQLGMAPEDVVARLGARVTGSGEGTEREA